MRSVFRLIVAAGLVLSMFAVFPSAGVAARDGGYDVTADLWAKAVLKPASGNVALIWRAVGTDMTPSGAQVVSGYFYADPDDFAYGSIYNPELFVKIYIDPGGWCNIAFNHVTVDNVVVYTAHRYGGAADQAGTVTLNNRLAEHQYTGVSIDTRLSASRFNQTLDPGFLSSMAASDNDGGFILSSDLWAKVVLQVAGNPVTLIWKSVGSDTTPSGDRVVSGYFYADPDDFAYGSAYNPEIFVKVYIAKNGWANIAFNHVTVDDVSVNSAYQYKGTPGQSGAVRLNGRLSEHQYDGVIITNDDVKDSDGDSVPDNQDQCPNTSVNEKVDEKGCSSSQNGGAYIPDGVFAYYPFSGNANDASGNAIHGTVYGAIPAHDRFGSAKSAYGFDGDKDYIEAGTTSDFSFVHDGSDFTISVWAKHDSDTKGGGLLGNTIGGDRRGFYLGVVERSVYFAVGRTTPYPVVGHTWEKVLKSGTHWNHIVVTYDGSADRYNLYVNGENVDEPIAPTNAHQAGKAYYTLKMGTYKTSPSYGWVTADIDEVGFFRTPLSDAQVKALYQNNDANTDQDVDNDGIPDNQDHCPNTPAGETVDGVGCPLSGYDTDKDGISDNKDQCPNTPAGSPVDGVGCPIVQSDIDVLSDSWDVTGRYSNCGTSGTAYGTVLFQSSGNQISGYTYTGEDWHHDCTVTNIGSVQDNISHLNLSNPLSVSEVKSFCEILLPSRHVVTVDEFSSSRFSCSYYDPFDGSIEIVTYLRNK